MTQTTASSAKIRFRYIYIGLGTLFSLVLMLISDPDLAIVQNMPFGASTLATLIIFTKVFLAAAVFHVIRKGLFDYIDLESVFNQAVKTSEGAGRVFVGMGLFGIAVALLISAVIR